MIFPKFREFRNVLKGSQDYFGMVKLIMNYLEWDLAKNFKELEVGLRNITFDQNFQAFTVEVTVPALSTLKIRNELQAIPTGMIVLRSYGFNDVVDAPTEWTSDYVYLTNLSAADRTVRVVFLR